MTTGVAYEYSLATDFPNGLEESLLSREIADSTIGIAPINLGRQGDVVTITFTAAVDKPTLDAVVAAHNPAGYTFAENFLEEVYIVGRIHRHTWFARKLQNGEYVYKVTETLYTYDATGVYLIQEEWLRFAESGSTIESRAWSYTTTVSGDTTTVRKEEV